MKQEIELKVNGRTYGVEIEPSWTLLDVLRDHLYLIGTKKSCAEGACGACTVLVDHEPINSCLMLAIEAQDKEIMTIEGLSEEGKLDPIQEAFVKFGAVQCGFCTPGMIIATKALLERNPSPSEDEIKKSLSGHLCRCTGYVQIIEAVTAAAEKLRSL